ncbi:MAG: hypothetical protein DWQ07_21490 [Chloroflexi bacterium]|nr:MAG: hypothetical protein DWQ07_21490 [Chloroflexota bacterium]MBL1196604.1 hypothetical protein [Chloroflexota bacterium]NOH13899.1 hypothetical protein [Chloroflexota bacterium]
MFKSTKFLRSIVILGAVFYLASGIGLVFAPGWFYTYVAHFPPFNRHFLGDAGVFALALGIGLFMISRRPWEHRSLYVVVTLASLMHASNHLYDAIAFAEPLHHWLTDAIPVSIVAILFILAWPAMQVERSDAIR